MAKKKITNGPVGWLLFSFVLLSVSTNAQSPFKRFGHKDKILTMSAGKYNELHDMDSVVEIGTILFDVNKNIIVGFVEEDTITPMPSPAVISRWWAVDRLAEKYYNLSPYNFVDNNPIKYVDPNGDSIALHEISQGGISGFQNIVSRGSGGYYQADVDSETGIVSIVATDQKGDISDTQSKFVSILKESTTGNGIATINVGTKLEDVPIGLASTHTMDVGDMAKFGFEGKITAQKTLLHEVTENYQNQALNQPIGMAHVKGGTAEARVDGTYVPPGNRNIEYDAAHPSHGVLRITPTSPASQTGPIRAYMYNNNVLFVTGNKVPIIKTK